MWMWVRVVLAPLELAGAFSWFSSSSRLISPGDDSPLGLDTVSSRVQAGFRLSFHHWGHEILQKTQPAFWEADVVGVA